MIVIFLYIIVLAAVLLRIVIGTQRLEPTFIFWRISSLIFQNRFDFTSFFRNLAIKMA